MIQVKIVGDSVNPLGTRLTSWLLTYPRFIHSEFMTHRVFSRNAASSRAIPFKRMLAAVNQQPAFPEYWGAEQKGMAPVEEVSWKERTKDLWIWASIEATTRAKQMVEETGIHKSIANRLLEPFGHITVLATATDHKNFFALRANKMAEPTFQVLAFKMLEAYLSNVPRVVDWGGWHMPDLGGEWTGDLATNLAICTARCARLSYLTHDGTHSPQTDVELWGRLKDGGHWSPFEHPAQAHASPYGRSNYDTGNRLCGWTQYRKMFETEFVQDVDLVALLDKKPEWIR